MSDATHLPSSTASEKAAHTLGPWRVDFSPGYFTDGATVVRKGNGIVVAVLTFVPEKEANARLIAASPRLLAALYECEAYLTDREDVVDGSYGEPAPNREMSLLIEVSAAIKAAEGVKP